MKSKTKHMTMTRKEFIELSTGMIGGLGIPAVFGDFASAAKTEKGVGTALDDSYLITLVSRRKRRVKQ